MNFSVADSPSKVIKVVWFETEHFRVAVGEISNDRGIWRLHHRDVSAFLTDKGRAEMLALVNDTIVLLNITARLLK